MSLIRKHVAVLQAWACLALVYFFYSGHVFYVFNVFFIFSLFFIKNVKCKNPTKNTLRGCFSNDFLLILFFT